MLMNEMLRAGSAYRTGVQISLRRSAFVPLFVAFRSSASGVSALHMTSVLAVVPA